MNGEKKQEYLFVYANGGWWLKLTTVDALMDYHQKVGTDRYADAFQMYMHQGHPDKILGNLSLAERIKMMNDIHFKRLQAAVIQAENGNGTILDGFRWLNIETGMKEMKDIKTYGAVYINRVGGSTGELEYTQFCRRTELVYPDFKVSDIRIKRFEGGNHYYAYIGDMQVRNGYQQKWNCYDDAYHAAEAIVRGVMG